MLLTLTTTGKVTLLIVAGAFILWALITAMWIPKRNPDFPITLTGFVVVSSVFFVLQMGAIYWVTGTQEIHDETRSEAAAETETTETTATETEAVTETATETETVTETATETETGATTETETGVTTETETSPGDPEEGDDAALAAGKEVFLSAEAGCGNCHTLADAGTNGSVGPNLDDNPPSAELVIDRVTNGKGVMPAYDGKLTEQQIADVATYVSTVAGTS